MSLFQFYHLLLIILTTNIQLTLQREHFSKYNDISFPLSLRRSAASQIKSMFNFGFDNYMKYAFPHDELKPITGSYTDSLPELGNAKNTNLKYKGLSLTLIDALDSLLLFNRTDAFINAHKYLSTALYPQNTNKHDSTKHKYKHKNNPPIFPGFDIDIRVHVFETNIRILGGLLSAHSLSTHPKWKNLFFKNHPDFDYKDEFLTLATDLGDRLLHAFNTSNSIPFAWINLKRGVLKGETRDTCTAGVGTLVLEMSLLSYFTKNDIYFLVAHKALLKLWKLRNVNNNLLGNSFNGANLKWLNHNGGIGAGIDSFYEYLLKSYIYVGYEYYWDIFQISYYSILKYVRKGPWYIETNIKTSKASHFHFNSLQSFWPSLQILIGDIPLSLATINSFFSIWYSYNGLPERFLLNSNQPHHTENQYPLRPELIESIFYAFESTKTKIRKDKNNNINQDYYLWLGYEILSSIQNRTKTKYGYTILNNVITGDKGDYMPSYFLAETCKYLLLLFDENNILHKMQNDYIFTTEGHIFPFYNDMREYIESVIIDKNPNIIDEEEDNTYIIYQKYNKYHMDDNNDDEIELDDEYNDIMEENTADNQGNNNNKKKANKTYKKKDEYNYNSLRIINSANIESIFIYQYGLSAICPSSPFYMYWLMHHNKDEIVYNYNKNENNMIGEDDTDGMWYLWDWIHKIFGKKNEIYKNKQISTITVDGNIQIGDQCPIPPEHIQSSKTKNRKKSKKTTKNIWDLSENNRVRISHDVGHFTINFIDHIEKLEIFNLGTNWIEMTNSIPINSKYSQFYNYFNYINQLGLNNHLNKKYLKINDVSINYLFETVGPTKYEIRIKTNKYINCYINTIYNLLLNDFSSFADILIDDKIVSIKASSAYFRPQPNQVTIDEFENTKSQCNLERVIARGILVKAESPSTSCKFPENIAEMIENDNINNNINNKYIILTDRGECTFYDKISVLNMDNNNNKIVGVIVGNIIKHSNGNIFTMGSDGTEELINVPSLMINKLSYNALTKCSNENKNNNMIIEFVEILTRCEKETISQLNVHGINSHFFISSLSNAGFVVTQNNDIFRLSLPQ